MPPMNGFELCEKILLLDINVKVCFMTAGEINQKAIRELYPLRTIGGCFIKKPVGNRSSDQTVNSRVRIGTDNIFTKQKFTIDY